MRVDYFALDHILDIDTLEGIMVNEGTVFVQTFESGLTVGPCD